MVMILKKTKQNLKTLSWKVRSLSEAKVLRRAQAYLQQGKSLGGKHLIEGPKKFLSRPEIPRVVIEITDTHVKIAQASVGKDSDRSERYFVKECLDLSDNEITAMLEAFFIEEGIPLREVVLVIPHSRAFVRTLRLPTIDEQEIKEMVRFHAGREVPLPEERILYGYRISSVGIDGYSTVYLSILDRNVVDRYMTLLGKTGIEPVSVRLKTEGVVNYILGSVTDPLSIKAKSLAVIDLDFGGTDVSFIIDGQLAFTRSISVGVRDIMEELVTGSMRAGMGETESEPVGSPRKSTDILLDDLLKTFGLFRKETTHERLSGIVLTGVLKACRSVKDQLENVFNLPVEVFPPTDEEQTDGSSLGTRSVLGEMGSIAKSDEFSFASLAGLLAPDISSVIDHIPPRYIQKRQRSQRRREMSRTAVMGLIFMILISLIIQRGFSNRKRYLAELEAEISTILPVSSRIENMENRMNAVSSSLTYQGEALDVLREVHTLIPAGISLNLFSYTREKSVVLKGTALQMSEVFALIPKLEESAFLQGVSVGYASKRKLRDSDLTDFQITMKMVKPGQRNEIP